ncbi:unnamed protein product [Tenebrio molitor]|nr:unnamed protein product [Tenebrio molitor]
MKLNILTKNHVMTVNKQPFKGRSGGLEALDLERGPTVSTFLTLICKRIPPSTCNRIRDRRSTPTDH